MTEILFARKTTLDALLSTASITAGVGLSGGGALSTNPTINLDINDLTYNNAPVLADYISIYDTSGAVTHKTLLSDINAILDHNTLLNYSANQHVDHTTVSIATAVGTSGLTGGGDLSSTRNLSVDINALTNDASPDSATDYVMTYDASTAGLKKVLLGLITPIPAALTKIDDANVTLTLGGSPTTALLQATSLTLGWTGTLALSRLAQGSDGQIIVGQTSTTPEYKTVSGDATLSALGALTLASVIAPGGPIGSTIVTPVITYDAKGRLTAVTSATIAPAVGSITGLGTGVSTALAINVGSAGAFVVNGGALGTPSSGTLTNTTGLPITGLVASTSSPIGVGSIELGHASDTTITRVSSGLIAVEGSNVLLAVDIGVLVQAYDADLTTWAGITPGANVGTFLVTPSSANLAAAVTDETGSGALVFGTAPTFTTSITTPLIYGGLVAGSSLTLRSTSSGAPSGDSIIFNTGGSTRFTLDGSGILKSAGMASIYIDTSAGYIDRGALYTLYRDISSPPTGVQFTEYTITGGLGDNTTLIGVGGHYMVVGDRAGVVAGTKGILQGLTVSMRPNVTRDNSPYDDCAAIVAQNDGTAKGTDTIYIGTGTGFVGSQWTSGFFAEAPIDYPFRGHGDFVYGLLFDETSTFSGAAVRIPNNTAIVGRNATNNADIALIRNNASNVVQVRDVLNVFSTGIGIGTTSITRQFESVINNSANTLGQVRAAADAAILDMVAFGSAASTYGTWAANQVGLFSNNTINIMSDSALGHVKISAGGNSLIGDFSSTGFALTGIQTITSAGSSAFAVGRLGATTPAFLVDASTATSITGIKVKSAATTGGVALSAIGETNVALNINSAGSGAITLNATGTGAIQFSRNAVPTASDGAALGTTALMWSDLFLASGGILNFDNGNVTLTHSAAKLTLGGAPLLITPTTDSVDKLIWWDDGASYIGGITKSSGNIGCMFTKGSNTSIKFKVSNTYGGALVDVLTFNTLGSVVVGAGAVATTATDGFLYITTCAGTPTGVPTTATGRVAMVYDTTNNKLYVYNGGWKTTTVFA